MTPTGSARVQASFSTEVFHCYLPYDFPIVMHRFIKKMNPSLLIIMETELWPNLINACKKLNIRLVLANARLSKKSAEGYARVYRLTKDMLRKIDVIAAQSEADAKRFISLGAEQSDTFIVGNLKFNVDHNFQKGIGPLLFSQIENSGRDVIIAASTRKGEEKKILSAIKIVQKVIPSVLLIIVPRHPERFDSVYDLIEREGFKCLRRSTGKIFSEETQIVVGDSMGELNAYYSISHIAFVGGSLVDAGCQNILEPAALSLPIVVGPSQYNFAFICENLKVKGGLVTVRDEGELAVEFLKLIKDKSLRSKMGAIALAEFNANQEALPKLLEIIERQLN
jgi:3-deoxy-D-manno-octulosonic-acid transferase